MFIKNILIEIELMILPYKITHLLNFINSFPKLDRIYRKREKETWI